MLAVDRFDPRKGAKLSTYSVLWIRQSIRRALASQGKTIRLPIYAVDQVYHLGRAEMRLRERLGREASEAELATELDLTAGRIGELRTAVIRPASLDAPMGDDDTSRLADVVADENAELPGSALDKKTPLNSCARFFRSFRRAKPPSCDCASASKVAWRKPSKKSAPGCASRASASASCKMSRSPGCAA
jgi:DNA-directed RNA polymerase sigma subunit (sigma70/sigma32)